MIDRKLYNQRLETILKAIRDIDNDSFISKAIKSYKTMKLLRNECIFVSKEYLAAANYKDCATLDPNNEGIRIIIPEEDFVTDWYPIFANSFGPFNPKAYFESPIKVLWLLKEPFIKKESWVKGDRGGHNQAKENHIWEEIEENPTLENLIGITKTLLNEINSDGENQKYTEQDAIYHTNILEINHFPGLAFKTTKSNNNKVCEWGRLNINLIQWLIDFYSPNIVIGCKDVFFPIVSTVSKADPKDTSDKIDLFNWLCDKESIQDADFARTYKCSVLNRECSPVDLYREEIFDIATKEKWKNYTTAVVDGKKCLWINSAHHPSSSSWNDLDRCTKFSNWIKYLYTKYCN